MISSGIVFKSSGTCTALTTRMSGKRETAHGINAMIWLVNNTYSAIATTHEKIPVASHTLNNFASVDYSWVVRQEAAGCSNFSELQPNDNFIRALPNTAKHFFSSAELIFLASSHETSQFAINLICCNSLILSLAIYSVVKLSWWAAGRASLGCKVCRQPWKP